MKKIPALLCLLALVLAPLCGCAASAPAPAESAVPEEAYAARFQELRFPQGAEPSLWALTENGLYAAALEKLLEVVESASRSVDRNATVAGIVRGEAATYFAGQKSAEEVARLIQSKVRLYVSEQR